MTVSKYRLENYQSGTTWLKAKNHNGGFHFLYFDGDNYDESLHINDRGYINKMQYANMICRYLNDSNDNANSNVAPYLGWIIWGKVTRKNESTLIFHDAYFGQLEISWRVVRGNQWDFEPIPDDVMDDFLRFYDNSGALFDELEKQEQK